MKDKYEVLKEFYESRNRNSNFSNHTKLERFVLFHILNKYLNKKSRFLEIGCGINNVSSEYAKHDIDISVVDLFDTYFNILPNSIDKIVGDITNLSKLIDKKFDVIFVNGPMSHLFDPKEINKAIKECKKLLTENGVIIFEYLSNTAVITRYGLIKNNLSECCKKIKDGKMQYKSDEIYRSYFVDEFRDLVNKNGLEIVSEIGLDGPFEILKEYTNNLTDSEFECAKNLQLLLCNRKDMLALNTHILCVCKDLKTKDIK